MAKSTSQAAVGHHDWRSFVIRHDVNLHTEILDTPAFFWKEETHEENYHMVMEYLEVAGGRPFPTSDWTY